MTACLEQRDKHPRCHPEIMMRLIALISLTTFCSWAVSDDNLVCVQDAHDVTATADRLQNALRARKMTIFAGVDHAEFVQQADACEAAKRVAVDSMKEASVGTHYRSGQQGESS